ncbi:MAG: FecR domain-containing protein [Methylococcaceae bacterium]
MKSRMLSLILMGIFTPLVFAGQQIVGKVSFAKGSNAAQQPNVSPRLLGKDADIYQGDNIQTADDSFVIIEFKDGSKVTVRPNSNFKVEQFDSANKNAKLTVYDGGIRASTGEFAKEGAENFQIKTPNSTLKGAKNSDYSIRVCNNDCDDKKDDSVAKIVDIKGDVFAENHADKNARPRKLSMGAGLNSQDYLISQPNSYALMVFRDGEKITLQANSQLDIVKYDFQKTGKKDQILLKLATGGMRALTGSIGKKDHSAYAVDTPVATIGIRGTEYETVCIGDCVSNENDEGLYSHVTEGAISQTNASGETVLTQGQNSFIADSNTPATEIATLPLNVSEQINNSPSPNQAPDANKIFGSSNENGNLGSYVTINKGDGTLESDEVKISENANSNFHPSTNNTIVLSEGESSFSGVATNSIVKLQETPDFIIQDETPSPEFANTLSATTTLFSLNDDNVKINSAACVVE